MIQAVRLQLIMNEAPRFASGELSAEEETHLRTDFLLLKLRLRLDLKIAQKRSERGILDLKFVSALGQLLPRNLEISSLDRDPSTGA